jgi:hypothetical protein
MPEITRGKVRNVDYIGHQSWVEVLIDNEVLIIRNNLLMENAALAAMVSDRYVTVTFGTQSPPEIDTITIMDDPLSAYSVKGFSASSSGQCIATIATASGNIITEAPDPRCQLILACAIATNSEVASPETDGKTLVRAKVYRV